MNIARSRCDVPSRMKNSLASRIGEILAKCRYGMVVQFEVLPLAVQVPAVTRPLRIDSQRCCWQIAGSDSPGKEIGKLPIEILAPDGWKSHAKSLTNRISNPASQFPYWPLSKILRGSMEKINELHPPVPLARSHIRLRSGNPQCGHRAGVATGI